MGKTMMDKNLAQYLQKIRTVKDIVSIYLMMIYLSDDDMDKTMMDKNLARYLSKIRIVKAIVCRCFKSRSWRYF